MNIIAPARLALAVLFTGSLIACSANVVEPSLDADAPALMPLAKGNPRCVVRPSGAAVC